MSHSYMTCMNDNCEIAPCVDRRMAEHQKSKLQARVKELEAELFNWTRDQVPRMKVLTEEEHKNNQEIYCFQIELITKFKEENAKLKHLLRHRVALVEQVEEYLRELDGVKKC